MMLYPPIISALGLETHNHGSTATTIQNTVGNSKKTTVSPATSNTNTSTIILTDSMSLKPPNISNMISNRSVKFEDNNNKVNTQDVYLL